jgi:hypothetical protein
MKNNPAMIERMQKHILSPLCQIAGEEIKRYFLNDQYFKGSYQFPYNINPLAFMKYDIDSIYDNIHQLGWKKPEGVDANSTNCLLNSYAINIHRKQLGFHPYAFELANLVRSGIMDRNTAIKRLETPEDPNTVRLVKEKLKKAIEM